MHYPAHMTRPLAHLVLLLLALLVLPAVLGETLYKWVDAQGNVHYSDKPQPGATKIHLPHAQTFTAPAVAAPVPKDSGPPVQQGYSSFQISSPAAEETLSNVQSVTVTVALQPGLQEGDQVTITMDDRRQGPGNSLSATFDNIERGEHTAGATLIEANGQVMTAPAVTFFVQKATKKLH